MYHKPWVASATRRSSRVEPERDAATYPAVITSWRMGTKKGTGETLPLAGSPQEIMRLTPRRPFGVLGLHRNGSRGLPDATVRPGPLPLVLIHGVSSCPTRGDCR